MFKKKLTDPTLVKSKQGWYVYIRDTKTQQKKTYSLGLNRIKDLKKREKEFKKLKKALEERIKEGWSPFDPSTVVEIDDSFTLKSGLNFAIEKKEGNISSKTFSMYRNSKDKIIKVATLMNLSGINLLELRRLHVRQILEKAKKYYNWSDKNYNKHLNHLKSLFTELINWDLMEVNPAHKIPTIRTFESNLNKPATLEEHKKIKEYLLSCEPNFLNFVATIFHTGIRPKEILSIQIHQINLEYQTITLPPENTKTKFERIVPCNSHMIQMFEQMEVENANPDHYLFGSFREKGRGNIGKFEDFIIGSTPIKRDTATRRWYKRVKKELNINVNMYSNKHAGADAKILSGISLDALRELYGHKSKMMTERYAKVIKNVYRDEIMNNSPEF